MQVYFDTKIPTTGILFSNVVMRVSKFEFCLKNFLYQQHFVNFQQLQQLFKQVQRLLKQLLKQRVFKERKFKTAN